MRISDWSPDVCSSDLEGARAVPGHGIALVTQLGIGLGDRGAADPDGVGEVPLAGQSGVVRDPALGDQPAQGVGQSRVGRRAVEVADEGGHRSAEPTPELQSLMRISYAVFWLEQKT